MLIGLIWKGGVGTKEVHGFSVYLQVSITPMQVSRENIITGSTQWRKDRSCEEGQQTWCQDPNIPQRASPQWPHLLPLNQTSGRFQHLTTAL